jgi:DNA-binding MarR family transcriptional regulator
VTPPTGPLEVVGRLLLCAQLLHHDLVVALRPFNVSFGDFDVINTLRRRGDEHGTNPRDLAQSALITSGAMTSRLDRLERRELVERTPDPADGRAVRVRLTRSGEQLAKQALRAVLAADEAFLQPLGDGQRDAVASALKQLLLARDERRE